MSSGSRTKSGATEARAHDLHAVDGRRARGVVEHCHLANSSGIGRFTVAAHGVALEHQVERVYTQTFAQHRGHACWWIFAILVAPR